MEKEETPMQEKTPMKEKVTKEKHPGRVESGKRLAERNKLKKLEEKNKEHKEKIITQEEEPKEKINTREIEKPSLKNAKNISLLLLVVFAGGGFYFRDKIIQKWKSEANSEKTTKEVKSEAVKPDPFYME